MMSQCTRCRGTGVLEMLDDDGELLKFICVECDGEGEIEAPEPDIDIDVLETREWLEQQ